MTNPQKIRKQRRQLAIVAVLGVCGGLALGVIWAGVTLWQMLIGR